METETAWPLRAKVATTAAGFESLTRQTGEMPLQPPLQPVNLFLREAAARSVTFRPGLKVPKHFEPLAPHEILAPVTVPPPDTETERVTSACVLDTEVVAPPGPLEKTWTTSLEVETDTDVEVDIEVEVDIDVEVDIEVEVDADVEVDAGAELEADTETDVDSDVLPGVPLEPPVDGLTEVEGVEETGGVVVSSATEGVLTAGTLIGGTVAAIEPSPGTVASVPARDA